jgi:hypothetical protein
MVRPTRSTRRNCSTATQGPYNCAWGCLQPSQIYWRDWTGREIAQGGATAKDICSRDRCSGGPLTSEDIPIKQRGDGHFGLPPLHHLPSSQPTPSLSSDTFIMARTVRQGPSFVSVLSLLVLGLLALPTQALYFYMDGDNPKCFLEELPKDTLVVGMFLPWEQCGTLYRHI